MIVREFRPNDLRRVYEIEVMSFSNPYDIVILKQLFDLGTGFLVAQTDNYVVGYVIFWIIPENQGHVISLAVDQNYKRQKIGSKLLNNAIYTFTKFDIFKISLEVRADNQEAINFYSSLGFISNEIVENYYKDGEDALKMSFDMLNK